ncbi:hypothetical protein LWI28_018561 [Acer negundo]|uniref:Snakin-2 n=1 Tax=Acer negundo TaxID=4023 RepID=A0AAD5JIB3_ACENE|nr:hypothetical protein LWI28_018561 [Acer negundo]KAK4860558.1 hypothetical protein QYF36_026166 [Acer negundo]
MAISKTLIFSFLISLLLLLLVLTQSNDDLLVIKNVTRSHLRHQKIDCDAACGGRCELSSRPRLCKRACGTCCARCDCVPPGTSGNYDACPCYANMTTHGGRHKCP